jgi:hypothetical protein
MIFLFVLPCIGGMTGMNYYVQPMVEMGSLKVFAKAALEP